MQAASTSPPTAARASTRSQQASLSPTASRGCSGTLAIQAFERDPIFDGIDPTFHANVTHIDTVVRLPPGAVSLARSPMEDNHAIRFTEICYEVQFHPEIDADVMRGYVEARKEVLEAEWFRVDAMLAAIHDAEMGRRAIQSFVRAFVR